MADDREPAGGGPGDTSWFARLGRRLERTKVTPMTVLLFMGVLAMMSGLAAGVGYLTHAMGKR